MLRDRRFALDRRWRGVWAPGVRQCGAQWRL